MGVAVAETVAIGVDDEEELTTSENVSFGVSDDCKLDEKDRSGEAEADKSADGESDGAVVLDIRELREMNAVDDSIGDADALENSETDARVDTDIRPLLDVMLDCEANIESVAETDIDASELGLATFDGVAVSGALGVDFTDSERKADTLSAVDIVAMTDMVSHAERDWYTVTVVSEEGECDKVALALL